MSDAEAIALNAIGRDLAARNRSGDADTASVIRCTPITKTEWNVFIDNAIGVISVGTLQILVRPKIPLSHLTYLFYHANMLPRFVANETSVSEDAMFIELVARWYVRAIDKLLHAELLQDYREIEDDLDFPRGSIHAVSAARAYYSGSLRVRCSFDEFDTDTPLNRILKAGARAILVNTQFDGQLRKRARRILARFERVGELRHGDLRSRVDRITSSYTDALMLAKLLITGGGRSLSAGDARGWAFLIPTPYAAEAAIRNIINESLGPRYLATKVPHSIGGGLDVNPDLWFEEHEAVADVKYKDNQRSQRDDLYQSVAFAAASRSSTAAVISFSTKPHVGAQPSLKFGDITVTPLVWHAHEDISPVAAAEDLVAQVKKWLECRNHKRSVSGNGMLLGA